MQKDPVCGMEIDKQKNIHKVEYNGKNYYFCMASCKKLFNENPNKYIGNMHMHKM